MCWKAALASDLLREPRSEERIARVRAAFAGKTAALERLRGLAKGTDDATIRGAALAVIAAVGGDESDARLLVDALGSDDVADRAEAAIAIAPESLLAMILAESESASPPVRGAILAVACAASGLHQALVAPLRDSARRALSSEDIEPRAAAIDVLSLYGDASDLRAVARLVTEDSFVSLSASSALVALAPRFADEAKSIVESLDPSSAAGAVGCALISALGDHRRHDTALAYLRTSLSSQHAAVRRAAVDAFAIVGGDEAAEAVAFAVTDEDAQVALTAVRALGPLKRPEPLRDLVSNARDPALVSAALRALSEADPEAALRASRDLLHHADPELACAAVSALVSMSSVRSKDALLDALEHPDVEVVKLALAHFETPLDARALARVGLCLDHASWDVRRLAAELLGQDKTGPAEALLRARWQRERDPVVKETLGTAVSVRPPPPTTDKPSSSSGGDGS